jgi:hypothetical protein
MVERSPRSQRPTPDPLEASGIQAEVWREFLVRKDAQGDDPDHEDDSWYWEELDRRLKQAGRSD